jgi:hypothetical protein
MLSSCVKSFGTKIIFRLEKSVRLQSRKVSLEFSLTPIGEQRFVMNATAFECAFSFQNICLILARKSKQIPACFEN